MLDTVAINTENYELKPDTKILTQTIATKQGEFLDERNLPYNQIPHMTILFKSSKTGKFQYYQEKLFVRVDSLPKALYGSSLYETNENDFDRTIDFIESGLNEVGIKVNINDILNARLSRVDICRNLEVEHPIPDYIRLLSNFEMSRHDKTEFKNETLTFGNTLRQFAFYDKIKQIKQDKKISETERKLVSDRPENILRVESRKLKNRSVVSTFKGQVKLKELFNCKLCKNELLQNFNRLVSPGEQLELNLKDNIELLNKVGSFSKFLQIKGVEIFLNEFNYDYKLIREFLSKRYSKSQVYYLLDNVRKMSRHILRKEKRELLSEIKYKLAA